MHKITFILLVVGGLNWLLVGVLGWDVGVLFGGQAAIISRIIYILVGLSALYEIFTHKKNCKSCEVPASPIKP
jgi:uncharacterized membrane protein YuzA (DUF378 family)